MSSQREKALAEIREINRLIELQNRLIELQQQKLRVLDGIAVADAIDSKTTEYVY